MGFVLQEKEHTMPITLVPELCCLIIARLRTRGQFKVLSFGFDQFSQDFRLRLFSSKFLFLSYTFMRKKLMVAYFPFQQSFIVIEPANLLQDLLHKIISTTTISSLYTSPFPFSIS